MNPLQNLKDIHLPDTVQSWPPAWGWWLLAAISLTCLYLTIVWLWRFNKARRAKKEALLNIRMLNQQEEDFSGQLNQLLKRVAMTYFPQAFVQQLHGDAWSAFLSSTLSGNTNTTFLEQVKEMQSSLYKDASSTESNIVHQQIAETWIKKAIPPNRKTLRRLEQSNV